MRILILAAALGATALSAMPAEAQYGRRGYGNEVRREQRECRRELRQARNRWEYRRELRECRREIEEARRHQRYRHRY